VAADFEVIGNLNFAVIAGTQQCARFLQIWKDWYDGLGDSRVILKLTGHRDSADAG
jgi:hypothetical protein